MLNKYLSLTPEEKQILIKTIVIMKDEGHTMKEISSHTGIHVATAKKLYLAEKANE
jgi:uncharacterized protein YerC